MPFLQDKESRQRFGLGLIAASGDDAGLRGIQMMDQQKAEAESLEQERKFKIEEAKKATMLKLVELGIKNGADEDTLNKLFTGAGIQAPSSFVGGIASNAKRKRFFDSVKSIDDVDPDSLNQAIQGGFDETLLRARDKPTTTRPQVLKSRDILVDADGNVLAENTNVAPRATTARGFKQQNLEDVQARNARMMERIGDSNKLSDRYMMARAKIDEFAARDLIGTSEAKNLRERLDSRREALIRYDNAADQAMSILSKDPTAATVGGDTAKSLISMTNNILGLADLIPGVDIDSVDLDPTDWSDELNEIAGDNAALRSTMFNLAVQMAVADGLANGRLSNQQLEFALENIGAAGRSPQAMRRKLTEARQRVSDSLKIALDGVLGNFEDLDRADPTANRSGSDEEIPEGVTPSEWANMSEADRDLFR